MKLPVKINKKIFLYAAGTAIIVVFLFNFIFIAMGKRPGQIDKHIKLAEAKLKQILEIKKAKDAVTLERETYQPYLKTAKWDEKNVVEELLKEVERVSKEARVSVINLSPQPLPEAAKGCKKYKADLRIDASLDQIFNFLRGIETSKLLIKVDKITVASKGEDGSILKSEMTIAIAVP